MKNSDSHVFLYAKGWYKKIDMVKDLQIIYGLRNGIDPEYMSVRDIVCCLSNLVWPYIRDAIDGRLFFEFISDIDPNNTWRVGYYTKPGENYVYEKAIISKFLSILSLVEVVNIPEGLDEPDYSVLPSSK